LLSLGSLSLAQNQNGRTGERRPKLPPQQQVKIGRMVSKGGKTAADAARLFKIHPATVSQLLTRESDPELPTPNSAETSTPIDSESDYFPYPLLI
jgi:hypothetical protein